MGAQLRRRGAGRPGSALAGRSQHHRLSHPDRHLCKKENYDALCAAYQDASNRLLEEDANALRNKVLTTLNTAAQAAKNSDSSNTAKSLYESVLSIASPGSQLATAAQKKIRKRSTKRS